MTGWLNVSYMEKWKMPNLGLHLFGHFVQILCQKILYRSGFTYSKAFQWQYKNKMHFVLWVAQKINL